MASEIPWEDITEKFCLCAICLEYFTEPKQLSCLHRFCKHCLNTLIKDAHGTFSCPECREEIELPKQGVDGFKTDFYTRNLVEYVQIKKTLKSDEERKCYGCCNLLKVAAYCFKCNDFLCINCYTFHMTNNTLKDHRQQTLSIDDIQSKNITMEKLASFRDAPRCLTHTDKISELRCETCNNLPVCMSCMFGDHKNHEFHEIKSFAKLERERLNSQIQRLEEVKESKLAVSPDEIAINLCLEGKTQKENFQKKCEDEVRQVKSQIRTVNRKKERIQAEKDSIKQTASASLQNEMDKEIQQIKSKYERLTTQKEKEIDEDFYSRENFIRKKLSNLHNELSRFDNVRKDMVESIEMQLNKHLADIGAISDHYNNIHERFKNLKAMSSGICSSANDWTAAECITDICTAVNKLTEDLKEFPDMETMGKIKIICEQKHCLTAENTTISNEKVTSEIASMKGLSAITDIAAIGDGSIFISGIQLLKKISFICLFDTRGTLIRQKFFNRKSLTDYRFCDCLSQFKVASVCPSTEIGIYDIRDDSYKKEDISKISDWPSDQNVSCIATNRLTNDIYVGSCNNRSIYVFDDSLTHKTTVIMPEVVQSAQDLTVHEAEIMICDPDTKKAYVVSIDDTGYNAVCELTRPELGKVQLKPHSVCTDSNGFIYLLWISEKIFGRDRYVLAQYSRDNRRFIETRQLGDSPSSLAILETEKGEKLLVSHLDSFNVYDLVGSAQPEINQGVPNQEE